MAVFSDVLVFSFFYFGLPPRQFLGAFGTVILVFSSSHLAVAVVTCRLLTERNVILFNMYELCTYVLDREGR